jgi:hypothetical protein
MGRGPYLRKSKKKKKKKKERKKGKFKKRKIYHGCERVEKPVERGKKQERSS